MVLAMPDSSAIEQFDSSSDDDGGTGDCSSLEVDGAALDLTSLDAAGSDKAAAERPAPGFTPRDSAAGVPHRHAPAITVAPAAPAAVRRYGASN